MKERMMQGKRVRLGVNIDHVATIRQARGLTYPNPVKAALDAEEAGADGITVHLREVRRHIQDRDVYLLRELLQTPMNLEMAATEEMIVIAEKLQPQHACLVPEKREELTTEGGLDVISLETSVKEACRRLTLAGTEISLFIDPDIEQINAAIACGAPAIELHTGAYAQAKGEAQQAELERLQKAAAYGLSKGLIVNAGHGLHYHNVEPIAAILGINELNIGHALIAHALFVGLKTAVKEMRQLILSSAQNGASI